MRDVMRNKIKMLNSELMEMATLVEKQIYNSIKALENHDNDLANEVIRDDDKIDNFQKQHKISKHENSNKYISSILWTPLYVPFQKSSSKTRVFTVKF